MTSSSTLKTLWSIIDGPTDKDRKLKLQNSYSVATKCTDAELRSRKTRGKFNAAASRRVRICCFAAANILSLPWNVRQFCCYRDWLFSRCKRKKVKLSVQSQSVHACSYKHRFAQRVQTGSDKIVYSFNTRLNSCSSSNSQWFRFQRSPKRLSNTFSAISQARTGCRGSQKSCLERVKLARLWQAFWLRGRENRREHVRHSSLPMARLVIASESTDMGF